QIFMMIAGNIIFFVIVFSSIFDVPVDIILHIVDLQPTVVMALVSLTLLICSYCLSCFIYEKKDHSGGLSMLTLIKKDFQIFNSFVYLFLSLLIFGMAYVSLPAIFMMIICPFAVGLSYFTYHDKNKTNIAVVSMLIKKQSMVISRYLYSVGILVIIVFIEWMGSNRSYSSNFEPYTFINFL